MFTVGSSKYEYDKNKVLFQVDPPCTIYDNSYVEDRYNSYGELGPRMANLRLGFLLGTIGFTPTKLLDVGYGNGDFLKTATSIVGDVAGFDVPPSYPIDPIRQVKTIYDEKFQVVCFFDSLEHFEDIYEISNLKTDYVFISVPNFWMEPDSRDFLCWKHRRPGEHLWHFDEKTLTNFFNYIGFNLISLSNFEDAIRKNPDQSEPNILSAIFKRK